MYFVVLVVIRRPVSLFVEIPDVELVSAAY